MAGNGDRVQDKPIQELLRQIDGLADEGALCWLKWTCPGCGERAVSDVPNIYHVTYAHDKGKDGSPCGAVYTGKLFELNLVWAGPGSLRNGLHPTPS
jgi:hypothetical protein